MSAIPMTAPAISPRSAPSARARNAPIFGARSGAATFQMVAVRLLVFGMIMAVAYGFSSLAGQTMMEQARREGIRSQERARQARMDVSILRQRVDRLTSMKSIDGWALSHGMVQQGAVAQFAKEDKKVASLH